MSEPMIELNGVHVSLPSDAGMVHILKGVDLEVGAGESVAVAGPSGSGKSTLLMVIAGLEGANRGKVRVAGLDLGRLGEDALALFRREHIGIVFQAFHLIATMTALENVSVPLELAGVRDAEPTARAELEAVGLGHRLAHYPGQLSGGEQQRVALARALASGPGVILADEPTGNLDAGTGGEVVDLMFRLQRERGTTLVLVTHDAALAARAGRIVQVRDGRIGADGPAPAAARALS
jgi:putative ABC transport system ATP-binding protein